MKKINLEKVRASLSMRCPQCGHNIQPDELRRMDTDHVRCPQCHAAFDPCVERKGMTICPRCKKETLHQPYAHFNTIMKGRANCQHCGREFLIENDVPRREGIGESNL
jgi:DNA-directed RNA polymerase subunit RPC12/RpoP